MPTLPTILSEPPKMMNSAEKMALSHKQEATERREGNKKSYGLNPHANQAVEKVLLALSGVVGLGIIELWVNTAERFSLHHVFKDETIMTDHQTTDSTYARFLAKKALSSKELFYWGSNRTDRLHPSSPYHTAVAFRFPRDNIGTDLYLLGYSSDYIKFAQRYGSGTNPILSVSYPSPISVLVFLTCNYPYFASTPK